MKLVYRVKEKMFSAGYAARTSNVDRSTWAEGLSQEAIDQIRTLLESEVKPDKEEDGPATYIIGFPNGEYTEIKKVWTSKLNGNSDRLVFFNADPKHPTTRVVAAFQAGSWAWFGKKDEGEK